VWVKAMGKGEWVNGMESALWSSGL
jgi:hypothetical protein